MSVRVLVGHVLARLADLPNESVHCVVTSPPYYGLRSYGTEPQVWGGGKDCRHDFQMEQIGTEIGKGNWSQANSGPQLAAGIRNAVTAEHREPIREIKERGFCCHCGAWRGDLGLEPTPELFIAHLVEVFAEVKRVMRRDATCWVNLGDSFANKQLQQIPARFALALQADGWWLRSEIVWAKKAPMPESCTDRPTCAHEKVFLLTKSARYFYDAEAVKEEAEDNGHGGQFEFRTGDRYKNQRGIQNNSGANNGPKSGGNYGCERTGRRKTEEQTRSGGFIAEMETESSSQRGESYLQRGADADRVPSLGSRITSKRNMRNVWTLGPEPFPEAHFATFVSEIPRRAILAGTSARGCCSKCLAPYVRVVEKKFTPQTDVNQERGVRGAFDQKPMDESNSWEGFPRGTTEAQTIGWRPSCSCDAATADRAA
jgi:DNA modification methylase